MFIKAKDTQSKKEMMNTLLLTLSQFNICQATTNLSSWHLTNTEDHR